MAPAVTIGPASLALRGSLRLVFKLIERTRDDTCDRLPSSLRLLASYGLVCDLHRIAPHGLFRRLRAGVEYVEVGDHILGKQEKHAFGNLGFKVRRDELLQRVRVTRMRR